jgi:membrane protein DedA with SNARE-associated domain
VLSLVGYFTSHGTTDPLAQNDATITAIIGLSITVAGGALFVRYSIAQFLRFWLARLSYEQQAQTDRVVEALGGSTVVAARSPSPAHAATDVEDNIA